jgi:acetyl-CoA C-acetyltransferase
MLVREQALPWVHVAGRGDTARSGLGAAPARKEISNMGAAEPLVFDAIRTPRGRGKVNGSLHTVKPVDLIVGLMHETLARNDRLDPNRIDDVVLGCVSPLGDQGADIAKTAAIKAGLPDTVAGVQLNRFCASGLEAVNIAAQKVASGWEDLVMAGGVESMSRVPMGSDGGAWAMDPETNYDSSFVPQGIGADLIATVEGFTREDLDAYAARSQERASAAQAGGRFAGSVVPVLDINGSVVLDRDEHIRPDTTVESLGGLKPSFASVAEMGGFDAVALQRYHWLDRIEHVHTAGNSSGIVDGASLVLVGNERTGEEHGLTPKARIVATAVSGADPTIMLTGPAPASRKALSKAGMTVEDLDLVEINEAFAAVVLRFVREMGLDIERVNVNGGAIAMGHPLGATGGMILGTLVDELQRTGGTYGMATLCVAGGMGIATVVEAI